MVRYQINHYVETPFGQLHIFSDPVETKKAKDLIDKSPHILWNAYKDAAERFGKIIIKEAKRCVNSGMPPKGVSWPPLSEKYVAKMGGDDRIYYKQGQYEENIGVWEVPVYYRSGAFAKNRYYVGLPQDVKKLNPKHNRFTDITLLRVAQILEQGNLPYLPPRPLWEPLFKANGGKDRIKTYVRNAIKRQLQKYM